MRVRHIASFSILSPPHRSINSLLEPVLAPIRRIMPETGAIDFSPLVLVVVLQIIMRILIGVAAG